jgi:hypothetical protein
LILGSVSHNVLHHSHVTVLIVRAGEEPEEMTGKARQDLG